MTNFERIKAMDIDELAKWTWDKCECVGCAYKPGWCGGEKCIEGHKEWLEQEAEE